MKALIVLAMVAIIAGCDGVVDPTTNELLSPVSYEIDGWGSNPDIYEWSPKGNPNYVCVYVVSGADGPAGVQCIPRGQ